MHHEAIISREDFFAVQKLIRNAKYGNRGYFPEMRVIKNGWLKGYVVIHPKWAGFSEQDYYMASASVSEGISKIPSKSRELRINKGEIDLSGYELVRSQFITSSKQVTISISPTKLLFNKMAVEKISDSKKVELLVYPEKKMIAVRKSPQNSRFGLVWSKISEKGIQPKIISGSAFIPTLYDIFSWNINTQYKITGTVHKNGEESILLFCADDAILLIEESEFENAENNEVSNPGEVKRGRKKRIAAYPKKWATSFGEKYYESKAKENDDSSFSVEVGVSSEEINVLTDDDSVTSPKQAAEEIKNILEEMGVRDE
jgi:hypothetical protein